MPQVKYVTGAAFERVYNSPDLFFDFWNGGKEYQRVKVALDGYIVA